jgi:arylsulfatase A-like enzyme
LPSPLVDRRGVGCALVSRRLSRRDLLGAAGAGVAGAGLAGGLDLDALEDALAAGRHERRNAILIVVDSLRADHLGAYGNAVVRSPNIDALARESLRFTDCHPEAMPTVPARRTLLTGRRAWPFRGWARWDGLINRAGWEPVKPGTTTIVSAFRRQGWWTGMVTDNPFIGFNPTFAPVRASPHLFVPIVGPAGVRRPLASVSRRDARARLPRYMGGAERIRKVRQYVANAGGGRDETQVPSARVFRNAARALERAARQRRPFFLYVDSFDPHEPWAPTQRYMGMYTDRRRAPIADVIYRGAGYMSAREIATLQATYKAELTMMDRWLGHLLDRLHDLRLDDSTAIALVADHGIYLGERNWTGKAPHLLHPELTNVPLLLRDPDGRGAGATSDWWATTVDVPRTLMALAGARAPRGFEGADLEPLLEGRPPAQGRRYAHGGYANYSYVRDERWAYVVSNNRRDERLYDRRADPGELRDVSSRHPDVVRRMWRRVVREAGGRRPPYYAGAE